MKTPALVACLVSLAVISLVYAYFDQTPATLRNIDISKSSSHIRVHNGLDSDPIFTDELKDLKREAAKPELRILSLGASIVWGVASSSQNGFRKPLREQLRFKGWEVNMIGSKNNGQMIDNNVQANPGDTIDQIHKASRDSYGYKANVVLINGGTNDCNMNVDIPKAGSRMESLISDLWEADGMEDALVVLSTVLPTRMETGAKNRISVNRQYQDLVERLRENGRPIILANMDYLALDDLSSDGIHPSDDGYFKMAYVWWSAIERAQKQGLIKEAPPLPNGTIVANTCDKAYGSGTFSGGLTQRGSGTDDGIYYHDSEERGIVLTYTSDIVPNQYFFARLYSRERDDLVAWTNKTYGSVVYATWRNTGNAKEIFTKIADTNVANNCAPRGVHFVDLNADGYDDFVCVDPNGDLFASINQGDGTDSKPPSFKDIGRIRTNEGHNQDRIRLGDIDGDGRADYCTIEDHGSIWCWRNGGVGDSPSFWEELGKQFDAKDIKDLRGIRLEDINGDGRDDLIFVNDDGAVTTWTNSRSCDGLNVAWRQGFHKGKTSGETHFKLAEYVNSDLRNRIHFARVFGEPQNFGLLGRQDLVSMEHTEEKDGRNRLDVRVWKNTGSGGTQLKPDGNKYCNMKGYPGRVDYVWTSPKGKMTLYPNNGLKTIVGDESFWGQAEDIWDPTTQAIGKELDRRDLHLVDWDGDGACDIIWTDPDNDNRVQLWLNKFPTLNSWKWEFKENPAPTLKCKEKRGLGVNDLAVRFADISGNGMADYICLEKDGLSSSYMQKSKDSWEHILEFKFPEGRDRSDLRWADVNGDGRYDMLWVDKSSGDASVWYNGGRDDQATSKDSTIVWNKVDKPIYRGNHAGSCMYYPDLDGDGRADMHSITSAWTNQAETWFNRCQGLQDAIGDDPGNMADPKMPGLLVDPADPESGTGDGSGNLGGDGLGDRRKHRKF